MNIILTFVLLCIVLCIHGLCAVATCTPSQANVLGCDKILDPQEYGGGHPDLIQLGSASSGEFDTSYAGLTLCVPAGNYSALALYYVEGSDNDAGRITIVNCGGAAIFDGRDSGAQGTGHWTTINILGSKYVHLRGDGDASVAYGLVARGSSSHGVHLDEGSTFVEVQNVETYANNYAGIVFRTYPRCGGRCGHVSSRASYGRLCLRGHFVQRESVLHDNYVHDTPGEGFYVGTSHYFQDGDAHAYDPTGSCAGETQPQPELKGVRIYGNDVHDTGMDGIQVGGAVEDVAIHHNQIKRWAHVQKYGDANAIGMNPGTVGSVYNNWLEGRRRSPADSEEYFGVVYYGQAVGGAPSRIYNNVVLHTNTAFMFLNKEDAPRQQYEFAYNTVYNFTGSSPLKVYCLGTEAPMLLNDTGAMVTVRNNIFALGPNEGIFSDQYGPHKRFYGNTNGVTGMDCLNYTDAYAHNLYHLDDAALVKFRGPFDGDFHLRSDSPARDAGVALPNGYFVGPDYDGVPRPADPAATSQGAFEFVLAPPMTAPDSAQPGPWEIVFQGIMVNFTLKSQDHLQLNYLVGKDREFETILLEKGCNASVPVNAALYNITNTIVNVNQNHSKLTLAYSFAMAEISTSGIWNSVANRIELCQILDLIVPDPKNDGSRADKMIIAQDKREIAIDFNLSATFSYVNNLATGTTGNATGSADFSSSVQAYKCAGRESNSFDDDATALAPNAPLYICIKSVDKNIEVAELLEMSVTQDNQVLDVIVDSIPIISAITSITVVDLAVTGTTGIIVKTRLPINTFNFSDGEILTITGSVNMQFVGSTRRLRDLVDEESGSGTERPEEASYKLYVNLKRENGNLYFEDLVHAGSSGGYAIINKGLATLALVFASAIFDTLA